MLKIFKLLDSTVATATKFITGLHIYHMPPQKKELSVIHTVVS